MSMLAYVADVHSLDRTPMPAPSRPGLSARLEGKSVSSHSALHPPQSRLQTRPVEEAGQNDHALCAIDDGGLTDVLYGLLQVRDIRGQHLQHRIRRPGDGARLDDLRDLLRSEDRRRRRPRPWHL